MKNFLSLAAFLFAAFAAQAQTQTQDISSELNALGNAWKAAFERSDATALASLYAERVTFVEAKDGSTTTQTRAEIEADWKNRFATVKGTFDFTPLSTTLQADGSANIKGTFVQTTTDIKTGEKKIFSATYDHMAVKEKGQWKLSRMKVAATN